MTQSIPEMEWLFHVDLDPSTHGSKADLQRSAGYAWDCLQYHQQPQHGDMIVIAVVRPKLSGAENGESKSAA